MRCRIAFDGFFFPLNYCEATTKNAIEKLYYISRSSVFYYSKSLKLSGMVLLL